MKTKRHDELVSKCHILVKYDLLWFPIVFSKGYLTHNHLRSVIPYIFPLHLGEMLPTLADRTWRWQVRLVEDSVIWPPRISRQAESKLHDWAMSRHDFPRNHPFRNWAISFSFREEIEAHTGTKTLFASQGLPTKILRLMVRKSPCGEGPAAVLSVGAFKGYTTMATMGFYFHHNLGHNCYKTEFYNDLEQRLYTPKKGPDDSQLSHDFDLVCLVNWPYPQQSKTHLKLAIYIPQPTAYTHFKS